MAGVNVTKIKGLIVLVPPLPEQNKFMKAAHLIAQQRKRRADGLRDSIALFDSLTQRAFRGELTNGGGK